MAKRILIYRKRILIYAISMEIKIYKRSDVSHVFSVWSTFCNWITLKIQDEYVILIETQFYFLKS